MLWVILNLLILLSFGETSSFSRQQHPAKAVTTSGYQLAEGVGDSKSFEDLVGLLNKTSATSIEDFLGAWKESNPILFRFYLLAYRSRSLQEASPDNPRAIIFHPTADFAAAFNGHPQQKGYQQIELYRFNYQKEAFEFYEINFSKGKKPKLSEPNPQRCLQCHQAASRRDVDPRPNWEPYFIWPGFFGSMGGALVKSVDRITDAERLRLDPTRDQIMMGDLNHEESWYHRFTGDIQSQHPRYKYLTPFDLEQGRKDTNLYGQHAVMELRDLMYTQRVAQLNFRRVQRLMRQDQEVFNYLKPAIISLLTCQTSFLPADFLLWLNQNQFTHVYDGDFDKIESIGKRLRTLFEPFYIDTEDWSMDFKTNGRFAFASRFGTPGRPAFELLSAIVNGDPTLASMARIQCGDLTAYTDILRPYDDISVAQNLQKQRETRKVEMEEFKRKPLIRRCMSCHVNPMSIDVPEIPFDQSQKLSQKLQEPGYKRGRLLDEILYRIGDHATSDEQMPPQVVPSVEQREELIQYLKGLVGVERN